MIVSGIRACKMCIIGVTKQLGNFGYAEIGGDKIIVRSTHSHRLNVVGRRHIFVLLEHRVQVAAADKGML